MAHNPLPALTYVIVWGLFVAVIYDGDYDALDDIPECEDVFDLFTGCNDTASYVLTVGVLGTIPGAPDLVNVFFAVIGLISRISIVWSLVELARGV